MKITAVLVVERIEPSLPFWTERLGFTKTIDVPDGDHLGFVILERDHAEVMLQTYESVEKDFGKKPELGVGSTALFIEVPDFNDIRDRVAGAEVIAPERVTFYGMREIGIKEPGGHLLIFAAKEG